MLTHATALPLWYQALEAEFGIAIPTNDRRWLQRILYEARQIAEDDALLEIMLIVAPNDKELWLVKKDIEL